MDIAADITFTREADPAMRIAPMLRTVAALNVEATVDEFVAAAVSLGYHPNTARKQFWESRKFDTKAYDYVFDAAGRLQE